jgi:hypothetical protein
VPNEEDATYGDFELPVFESEPISALVEPRMPEVHDPALHGPTVADNGHTENEPTSGWAPDDEASGLLSDFRAAPAQNVVTPAPVAPSKPVAWLLVVRGEKMGESFPIWAGPNLIGRVNEGKGCINLVGQEAPERVWTSRRHALLSFEAEQLILEDLGSLNGTFVNRQRLAPGERRPLQYQDVIQVGTVQLRLAIEAKG